MTGFDMGKENAFITKTKETHPKIETFPRLKNIFENFPRFERQ